MPNAADIQLSDRTAFLLIGDGGTHKTFFIGTCPTPAYVFDLDAGMAIHAGRKDIDYDTFKELDRGIKLTEWQKKEGWYEWGTGWPAILNKLNEIGKRMDAGDAPYKTIAFDSLTMLADLCLNNILKNNVRSDNPTGEFKDGRQMWQPFLQMMSSLFSQFSAWPVVKVLTAHVKRDENLVSGTTEKLPLISGQFAGKAPVYFDEVYFTETKTETVAGKPVQKFVIRSQQDAVYRGAKSRKYNVPNGTELDFNKIIAAARAGRANA